MKRGLVKWSKFLQHLTGSQAGRAAELCDYLNFPPVFAFARSLPGSAYSSAVYPDRKNGNKFTQTITVELGEEPSQAICGKKWN